MRISTSACRSRARNFASLCGRPLQKNKVLDDLLIARNKACERAINTARNVEGLPPADRRRPIRDVVADLRLPRTVQIDLDGVPLDVLFEYTKTPVVAMKIEPGQLQYLVDRVHESDEEGPRGKKRPAADQKRFEFAEVRFSYARDSPFVVYRDTDGKVHTLHKAPTRSDNPYTADAFERDAVAWLHTFYVANHVGDACDDAEQAAALEFDP